VELKAAQDALVGAVVAPVRQGDCRYTRAIADRFKRRGMGCAGQFLDDYADGLERSKTIQPVLLPLLTPSGEPEPGQAGANDGLPPEVPGADEQAAETFIPAPASPNPFDKPMDTGPIPPGMMVEDIAEVEPGDDGRGSE
jgi:hypothetical protein